MHRKASFYIAWGYRFSKGIRLVFPTNGCVWHHRPDKAIVVTRLTMSTG